MAHCFEFAVSFLVLVWEKTLVVGCIELTFDQTMNNYKEVVICVSARFRHPDHTAEHQIKVSKLRNLVLLHPDNISVDLIQWIVGVLDGQQFQ